MKSNGTTIYNESHSRILESESNATLGQRFAYWHAELERMDLAWKTEEETFLVIGRYGHRSLPADNPAEPIVGWVLGVGLVGFGISELLQYGFTSFLQSFGLPISGVIIIVGTLIATAHAKRRRLQYEEAKQHYEKQRTEHLQQRPT